MRMSYQKTAQYAESPWLSEFDETYSYEYGMLCVRGSLDGL
ncbi:hypothetical protein ACJO3K_20805 [Vibrio parahaemolyticus]